MVPSKLECFSALSCNLDDNFFSAGFMQLAQVRSLILRNNNFKHLPECIKEFHNLNELDVTDCKHLEEIRGFPPKLEYFNATNCISLTSTSLDMLLNKELYYEGRKIMFQFPGARFPEWFDLKSSGPSCSFWFRNKFPARVLSLLIIHMNKNDEFLTFYPQVYINGKYQTLGGKSGNEQTKFEFDLTYLSDLKMYGNFHEQPSEKEWNHVKVTYYAQNVKATGIHVFEENKEDIRFDDPYIMEDIMEEEQKEEEKEEVEEEEEEKKEKAEEEENSIMEDTMEEEGRRGKRRKLH
ncbi:uncharacterized protein HKW66_Vig0121160 [Vigna angularis]|nr:uncharacterized protein LOC108344038 isoform X2 [Vigna angularis]KAG2385024.1 uncharacterized protein HKW66_Vig0121160 [Vigna angularis]